MIDLIVGPMFSLKTHKLLTIQTALESIKKKSTILIKISNKITYDSHFPLSSIKSRTGISHIGYIIPPGALNEIIKILPERINAIFIDEAQFLSNEDVKIINITSKKFVISGLDKDYKKKTWEYIEKLNYTYKEICYARCEICNKKASYSARLSNSTKREDEDAKYISVCKKHWTLPKNVLD